MAVYRPVFGIWQARAKRLVKRATMAETVTIAHLTDVHLGPIAGFTPRYWNLKRGLGYLNWVRKRRHDHLRAALDRVVADLIAQGPDHIAVGGDLCNIGLPQEHAAALAWLESLGPPGRVSVVPGNHDIYCRLDRDPGVRRWASYMTSDAQGAAFLDDPAGFPFVRVVGRVALVGVNSALPTPPAMAWGRVGGGQLKRLAAVLDRLAGAGMFRLVLIHHPPLSSQASGARGLRDAAAVEATLALHGAELVVHGHNHLNMLAWHPFGSAMFPIVGAPSASLGRLHRHEPLARYNLLRIDPAAGAIELIGRGMAEPGGTIVEVERRSLGRDRPEPAVGHSTHEN
jgi:3',5'-cyclic AMP phosphodiesterase CpdA